MIMKENEPEPLPKTVKKVIKKKENKEEKEKVNASQQEKPNPRDRAKTINSSKVDVFNKGGDKGGNVAGRKESKPIATIGGDHFKNLLSKFDKKMPQNEDQNQGNNAPKRLNPNLLNNFQNQGNTNNNNDQSNNPNKGLGIQNKLNNYLEQARTRSKTTYTQAQDPILIGMKGNVDQQYEEEVDEEGKEKENGERDGDDLDISGGDEEEKEEELKKQTKIENKENDQKENKEELKEQTKIKNKENDQKEKEIKEEIPGNNIETNNI